MDEDMQNSGFLECGIQDSFLLEGLECVYVSDAGHTQLFKGVRYGKFHILKALKEEYRGVSFYEQALQKEFAIAYGLDHPNICRTMGWEKIPGIGHCILLEYIDGCNLHELMVCKKLTADLAYKILDELCQALLYLHNRQITHRDLKPENILITYNGLNVKLIDFGLSDCDDYNLLKQPAGTRYYLAPEVTSPGYVPNHLADIYSMGVLIGEIATQLKDQHLSSISSKCTNRDPECRYSSVREVQKALHTFHFTIKQKIILLVVCALLAVAGASVLNINTSYNPPSFPDYGNNHILSPDELRSFIYSEEHLSESNDTLELAP